MFSMKILVFLFTIIIAVQFMDGADKRADSVSDVAEKVKCDEKTDKRADDVLQLIMPVGSDIEMPESSTELKKYCTLFHKNFPFILGLFKHCSSSFGQTIAKLLISPVRKNMGNVCKEGKLTRQGRDFITASECANKARDRYKGCNAQLIDALNGIALAPVKSRIYMTCCHSHVYRVCLKAATEETFGCTQKTIDWAEDFVLKTMLGGSIDLVCGQYFKESDKCNKLIKETPKPVYSESYQRPKSMIKPMISLMEGFPDFED